MTGLIPERLAELDSIQLLRGAHEPRHYQFCAMELLAYLAGKPDSYSAPCASKVIAGFVSWINDWMTDEERQVLKPIVVRTFGTVGTVEQEQQRAFMCADWAVHFAVPLERRASGAEEQAAKFEALPTIGSADTARAALRGASRAADRDWDGWDVVFACLGSARGTSDQSAEDLAADGVNGTWAYWAGANAVRCLPPAAIAAARRTRFSIAVQAADVVVEAGHRKRSGPSPDPWQAQLLRSSAARILVNVTRQAGKSTTVAAPAIHQAPYQPGSLPLLLSPTLRQSAELFRRCLQLYARMDEPVPADAETMLRIELATGARIVSLPGKEGTVRGCSGVDLLAIERRRGWQTSCTTRSGPCWPPRAAG